MSSESTRKLVVGILSDPGLAQTLAVRSQDRLQNSLDEHLISDDDWEVVVDLQSLPLSASGRVLINEHADRLREDRGLDFIIYLTDIPQYVEGRPVRMFISPEHNSATVVLSMLGLSRSRVVVRWVLRALHELFSGGKINEPSIERPRHPLSLTGSVVPEQEPHDRFSTVEGLTGRLLLVLGLIRVNRPWRLIPRLSSAMAGATATGAFGVFYTSIWQMADFLPPRRLLLISITSILILALWLVFHNGLWERPSGTQRRERLVLYNVATVLSVGLAATVMYLVLFVVLFVGAIVVIDERFLSDQLGHEAGLGEYVNLIWLAASLGTLGGAIGSSFDDEQSVRQATFTRREYERRNLKLDRDDDSRGD